MADKGIGIADVYDLNSINQLPDISKTDIGEHRSTIISGKNNFNVSSKTTGGSTGQAVTILKNPDALARERAATWRAYKWAGVGIGDVQARFWGLPLTPKSRFISKIVDFVSNRSRLSAFSITENELDKYYAKLIKMKPAYLYGYVSMIVVFAEHIKSKGYPALPELRSIITTSEVLDTMSRTTIEEAFNVKVFNEYGCGEVGSIAHECEYGNMHIMAENMIVEVDKTTGPDGTSGEIIITDLFNYAMPLIRYRIGDFATISTQSCRCGRGLPILEHVHGRAYDMLIDPDGRKYHPEALMYVFEELKSNQSGIKQFQVIQKAVNKLQINLVPEDSYNRSMELLITTRIRETIHPDFVFDFNYPEVLEREKSGKMRVIKSELT
jgi:phenylacetate-CoA ligase